MSIETGSRRLAAILAADMVGYSRLMELDEAGTLARQKAIQTELINPKAREFGGRVVKTTGDGLLIEFPSAINAVRCAAAVQREITAREAEIAGDRKISYRIGINLGDIIVDGDDIFGDGVNVASRLEGLAEPGGIRISEAVFNNVRGKLDLGFADLGPQKVKNLEKPVLTYRVLLDPEDAGRLVKQRRTGFLLPHKAVLVIAGLCILAVGGFYAGDRLFAPAKIGPPRMLVLPVKAADADSRQAADAATENLIASFARLKGITTTSRDTSMRYKGIELTSGDVPAELDVRYVLDGVAMSRGDQVEITARLRDLERPGDGVVWEQMEAGSPKELFESLANLKQGATAAMKLALNQTERSVLIADPTSNINAYLAYAEAEWLLRSGDFTKIEPALPLFERAVTLDPDFTDARLGLAEINFSIWQGSFNTIKFTLDALAKTKEIIAAIQAANPSDARSLALQIRIQLQELNREQALTVARAGVFSQPDEPSLRYALGLCLLASADYDGAKAEFARYEALSPRLNSGEKRDLAWNYLVMGDADKALSLLNSIPAEEAQTEQHFNRLSIAYGLKGDMERAKIYMDKFLEDTVWVNLLWQKPWFEVYADPKLFKDYAAVAIAAGLPEQPFDFGAGREGDRIKNSELLELFSEKYEERHSTGPFGMPYRETRTPDGKLVMTFAWMKGIDITGQWYIDGDYFCHKIPAIHQGREECNKVYIDPEKSNDEVRFVSNVYSFGIFNSQFRRIGS